MSTPADQSEGDEFDPEGKFFEIVNGRRVKVPPPGVLAALTATRLASHIGNYAKAHALGQTIAHALFRLRKQNELCRRPDGAFVSFQRWPRDRPMSYVDEAWDVVPDLALEVITPEERAADLIEKTADYFAHGVRLVWMAYPPTRLIYVFQSLTQVRGLTAADELEGGAVLPGFRAPIAALFPETPPPR
jgi:Uma2 family endonuclease